MRVNGWSEAAPSWDRLEGFKASRRSSARQKGGFQPQAGAGGSTAGCLPRAGREGGCSPFPSSGPALRRAGRAPGAREGPGC